MAENRQHISLREGKAFINGVQVLDAVSLSFIFTPTVSTSTTLGSRGTNRRWIGHDITGNMTEYKSTDWLEKAVSEYMKTGKTPEFTIQGIRNDKNSDYYEACKKDETVTLTGVVITGDISLLSLDTAGETVQNNINFGAKNFK